jgi:hypothetical protein
VRAAQKNSSNIFLKIKENCAMLDRSIPTRKALNSIPISEVKDMKSDVLRALKASIFEKNFEPCLRAQFKQFSRKKNCIHLAFLSATFPPLGSTFFKFHLKFVSNSVFPFITYLLLLIDFFEVQKSSFF